MSDPLKLYLRAVEKLNNWNISEAEAVVALLKEVIELDPAFYRAYISLCNCYTWMGALHQIPQKEAAEKVNEILSCLKHKNHNLPDYYLLLAKRNFWVEWNRSTALRNCNRALEIQPAYADALILKGVIAASGGRGDRALKFLAEAERFAPLSSNLNYFTALIHMYRGEAERALFYLDRNIEISASWQQQYHEKVILHCSLHQFEQAEELIAQLKKSSSPLFITLLNATLALYQKRIDEAWELLVQVESALPGEERELHAYYSYLADQYLIAGEKEQAFDLLELGVKYRSTPLVFIQLNNLWDDYRSDPRFQEITSSMFHSPQKGQKRYERCELSPEETKELKKELARIMEHERPWLNPQLTRKDLSGYLNITAHKLSQLINSGLGTDFHSYCNQFRIARFLELSADPAYDSYTILAKAFDAGFASKSTFNVCFRKTMGTTPLRYCRRMG